MWQHRINGDKHGEISSQRMQFLLMSLLRTHVGLRSLSWSA